MSILTFGTHKDKDIEDVPSSYLRYLLESNWFDEKYPELVKEVEEELGYRSDFNKHF
jgi:hypothetical protein